MSKRKCFVCGRDPAAGHASIAVGNEERWYCHGEDDEPTCYEQASWGLKVDAMTWTFSMGGDEE